MKKPKVLISINTAWNVFNFRSGLVQELVNTGYDVVVAAPQDHYVERVKALGVRFISLPMDSGGTHPIKDSILFIRYIALFLKERPDYFLGYTIKPNIYGGAAANVLKIPVINNIAGLGSVFIEKTWLTLLVQKLYKITLKGSKKVFFQNDEDRNLFIKNKLVETIKTDCLPGSGVNLKKFIPIKQPNNYKVRFLLVARVLWEKGIGEFVEAAKILLQGGYQAEFCILGFMDSKNPSSIKAAQMNKWVSKAYINYLGVTDDVGSEMAKADCIVLPSYYREGTPRSLLEAAAMARPIITTDVVGCRNVVDDGVNGYICKPRDALHLAQKMKNFIELSIEDRATFGSRGRYKMEQQFDEKIVIDKYLSVLR